MNRRFEQNVFHERKQLKIKSESMKTNVFNKGASSLLKNSVHLFHERSLLLSAAPIGTILLGVLVAPKDAPSLRNQFSSNHDRS